MYQSWVENYKFSYEMKIQINGSEINTFLEMAKKKKNEMTWMTQRVYLDLTLGSKCVSSISNEIYTMVESPIICEIIFGNWSYLKWNWINQLNAKLTFHGIWIESTKHNVTNTSYFKWDLKKINQT